MKNIMQLIKKCSLIILATIILSCQGIFGGCGEDQTPPEPTGKTISLLCWNVQNIFDDIYDGTEYWEFNPDNEDWNTRLFYQRLTGVQKVVEDLRSPDILLFTEIENRNVIEILNDDFLLASHYKYTYTTAFPGSAIQLAILSKFPITSLGFHSPGRFEGRDLRPVLEIHLSLKKVQNGECNEIIIFLNHWKSRLGGVAETEPARIITSELLSWRVARLLTENPSALIMAAGDFNTTPELSAEKQSLSPYSEDCSLKFDNIVFVSFEKDVSGLINNDVVLYSPWNTTKAPGSYCYKGEWERIDNILLSPGFLDGKGWEFSGFSCYSPDFLQNSYQTPFRWNSRKQEGYSDHYPLFAEFVFF